MEAGLALPGLKSQDFVGKAAYTKAREGEPEATLCTLTLDARRGASPQGGEPVLTARRRAHHRPPGPAVVRHERGRGAVARDAPAMAYLPPWHAVEGTGLLVEYLGERLPGTVARAGRTPLFDPDDTRMQGEAAMDVLVCVKRVPAVGSEILLTADATAIDTRHLGFTIGPHEECAVEEAVRIAERTGGAAGVLTVGPPETEEQLRYALSMGADHAVRVDAPRRTPTRRPPPRR